ncbi:hypothetical protein [Nocardia tengchongensis]
MHVLNSHTLAIVMLCGHNAHIIEHTIRAQDYALTNLTTDCGIITVAL